MHKEIGDFKEETRKTLKETKELEKNRTKEMKELKKEFKMEMETVKKTKRDNPGGRRPKKRNQESQMQAFPIDYKRWKRESRGPKTTLKTKTKQSEKQKLKSS